MYANFVITHTHSILASQGVPDLVISENGLDVFQMCM